MGGPWTKKKGEGEEREKQRGHGGKEEREKGIMEEKRGEEKQLVMKIGLTALCRTI